MVAKFIAYRAFSAAECVESQWAIAGNPLTELSVQELISCVRKDGCSGGNTYEALYWLQKGVKCFIYLEGQYYYIIIMCGYQCDKAVNKNDTHEVI